MYKQIANKSERIRLRKDFVKEAANIKTTLWKGKGKIL